MLQFKHIKNEFIKNNPILKIQQEPTNARSKVLRKFRSRSSRRRAIPECHRQRELIPGKLIVANEFPLKVIETTVTPFSLLGWKFVF